MFRSIGAAALAIERMHIVVEGDEGNEVTELEEVNGELQAVSEARKVSVTAFSTLSAKVSSATQ